MFSIKRYIKSILLSFVLILILFPCSGSTAQMNKAREHYRFGMEQLENGNFQEAWQSFSQAWQMDRQNSTYKRWLMLITVYMGENAIFENNHAAALKHFTTAFELKKEITQKKDAEYVTIERYINLTREHAQTYRNVPEYIVNVKALYILHTELKDVWDAQGKKIISKGTIHESKIKSTYRAQNILKFYIEALTKGRLSLSFERENVNTTLTRAVIYIKKKKATLFRPDFNSTSDSLGKILFEGINKFDAVFYYYSNDDFNVLAFANGVPSIFIPYTLFGKSRGSICMPQWKNNIYTNSRALIRFPFHWVHFHEFFHVIEGRSGGIGPQHAWTSADGIEKAKKKYPAWVPDMTPAWTATEYSWYRYHLHKTLPAQMNMKAAMSGLYPPFKNFSAALTRPDRTDRHVFLTYSNALKGISLDNLRKASELINPAYHLLRKKKIDEAAALYKKILEHNPYHHKALLALGNIALRSRDIETADRYFSLFAKVFPDAEELFSIAGVFYKQRDYNRAAKYMRIIADRPGSNLVYSYWLLKILTEAGDTTAAETVKPRLNENPVFTEQISYLTIKINNKAFSLFSNSNPEKNNSPGLDRSHRSDIYKWKILPSGENGYILIVSDYNWRCLEVQGGQSNYSIAMGQIHRNDAQKWKLIKGENGLFRIVSKMTGTEITVTIPAGRGKKAQIRLQPTGAEISHNWEIQQ